MDSSFECGDASEEQESEQQCQVWPKKSAAASHQQAVVAVVLLYIAPPINKMAALSPGGG